MDAKVPADTGTAPLDSGASNKDAAPLDAVAADAGLSDSGPWDSGAGDVPVSDIGGFDAQAPEAGADASAPDSMITCPDGGTSSDGGTSQFCTGIRIALLGLPGDNSSSDFQAWLRSQGQVVSRFQTSTQTSSTSSITAALLSGYDVVILDQLVRDYSTTEARTLRDWVAGGGGVFSMTGYTGAGPDYSRPNLLLAEFGIQYLPGLLNGPVTMFYTHPITAGLSSVTFLGGYQIALTPVAGGTSTVTATLSGGPVEVAAERGSGRVVSWGDEWVQFDSEWQTNPMIRQFWVDILGWLVHAH
jgi:hypothetical protein